MINTRILSGRIVASSVYATLEPRIENLAKSNIIPGLAVILVGDDLASQIYVKHKRRKFSKLGLFSKSFTMPSIATEEQVLKKVADLNNDDRFHGILIQLPIPTHISISRVLLSVNPMKDVDGFHPENMGLLASGNPRFVPCTPRGVLMILNHYAIDIKGKHVVVIGRSNIVGRPLALLLSMKSALGNATVTVCHSETNDLGHYTRQADILIVSAGSPALITGEMLREGAIVIDVGINRLVDDLDKGYNLVGDVDISSVTDIASAVTPVPGGVGPMTVAMLVENTIEAAERFVDANKKEH